MSERLLVGVIVGAHGVKGLVRVKSFTEDPKSIAAYGPLADKNGTRDYRLGLKNTMGEMLLCEIDGVNDRDAAQALKGTSLYVDRSVLNSAVLDEDEFFQADLIGAAVELPDGTAFGRVRAVVDFGAGDLLDIDRSDVKGSVLVPFTKACVPLVDLAAGRVVVDPPDGLLDDPKQDVPDTAVDGDDQ